METKTKTGVEYLNKAYEELEKSGIKNPSANATATHASTLYLMDFNKSMNNLIGGADDMFKLMSKEMKTSMAAEGSRTSELKLLLSKNCSTHELESLAEYINKELVGRHIGILVGSNEDNRALIFNCNSEKKEDAEHFISEVIKHNNFNIEIDFEWSDTK